MEDHTIQTKTKYGSFTVLRNEEGIGRELASGQHWGERLIVFLKKVMPANTAFVDIGAHIGTVSIPLAYHAKMVYSFEPQKVIYDLLRLNVEAHKLSNIKTYNMALGHKATTAALSKIMPDGVSSGKEIDYTASTPFNFGGVPLGEGGETVEMKRLDDLSLANVGAIKVDVEGAEPLVFYGARETIKTNRPIVIFESNYKRITDEMRRSLSLPSEVETFNVSEYCRSLGYQPPLEINDGDFALLPKHDIRDILDSKFGTPAGGVATFYRLGGYTYVMMFEATQRGPFVVHSLADNAITVDFDGQRFDAQLDRIGLQWSNETTWKRLV